MPLQYAISDIHGCNLTFRTLVEQKIKLNRRDELYLLGDYVDRGPDSKSVLDYIFELKEQGFTVEVIRGNHDQMMLDSLTDLQTPKSWLFNGGENTLRSFGVSDPVDIPKKYFQLIQDMDYFIETEPAFLVHAGFNFNHDTVFEDTKSMMYIRKMSIDNSILNYKKIIHGHTPLSLGFIQSSINSNEQEINIDNGCVFGVKEEFGNLTALELNSMQLYIQPNIEQLT